MPHGPSQSRRVSGTAKDLPPPEEAAEYSPQPPRGRHKRYPGLVRVKYGPLYKKTQSEKSEYVILTRLIAFAQQIGTV